MSMDKEAPEPTVEENLAKMRRILKHHIRQCDRLRTRLRQAQRRFNEATNRAKAKEAQGGLSEQEEIVLRLLSFDLDLVRKEYHKVQGKKAWAKRMAEELNKQLHSRPIKDKRVYEASELVHRPFAGLNKLITAS